MPNLPHVSLRGLILKTFFRYFLSQLFFCYCDTRNPFGQTYIQDNQVGLASYHFDALNPYISYETAPNDWILDNGQKLPPQVNYLTYVGIRVADFTHGLLQGSFYILN